MRIKQNQIEQDEEDSRLRDQYSVSWFWKVFNVKIDISIWQSWRCCLCIYFFWLFYFNL
jgi:hypothetical protein